MRGPILLALLVLAGGVQAQEPDLYPVAEAAKSAFRTHKFRKLLGAGQAVRVRLPERPAGAPVRWEVAAASLRAFTRRDEELGIDVVGAAIVDDGLGYIELERRFRLIGATQPQHHRVLLSVRSVAGSWRVVEVWVVEGLETTPGRG